MTDNTTGNADHSSGKARHPPRLHAVNAIRVIGEYFVVRHHILQPRLEKGEYNENASGPIGVDIMSFFFVLSGFVLMHSFEREDFSTFHAKTRFVMDRISKLYPIFLLNWLFSVPKKFIDPSPLEQTCWAHKLCPILQLVMLDSWFGCGFNFIFVGVSWFLSCLFWMWVLFPFIKDILVHRLFHSPQNIWIKLFVVNLLWSSACVLLWGYDIYTLSPFPPLRLGEFLIGCGAALAPESPFFATNRRYWIPFLLVILLYNLQRVNHGMTWLCIHENAAHTGCSIWHWGQDKLEHIQTPCITFLEKIVNKYALVWACLIHGVARDELRYLATHVTTPSTPKHWTLRVLHADIFKTLSKFSPTLYMSHLSMYFAVIFLGQYLMGWTKNKWRDDTLLFVVYLACYSLQNALICILDRLSQLYSHQSTRKGGEDHEPLVVNDTRV